MKVRSLRKRARERYVATAIIIAVIILAGLLLPRLFHAVSTIVLTPVTLMHSWLTTSSDGIPVFVRDRLALLETINSLENELAIAGGKDLTLSRLQAENERLRSLLGIVPEARIAAAVTGRPQTLPYDLLQLDRGSRHGVVVGAPVYVGEDRFLGVVADVASAHSFVVLLTHPDFTATGFIDGANVVTTLDGLGGGIARVRVPQGIALSVGDVVLVPSVEPGVFGRIVSVENRPTQPEQYGYIAPDVALSSIHLVSIGREPLQPATPAIIQERISAFIASSTLAIPLASTTPTSTIASTSLPATTDEN